MTSNYPTSLGETSSWARDNGATVDEARRRFAQYAVLRAISQSQALSASLVFKGGNALDFIWQPNRGTLDLDFSISGELATEFTEQSIRRYFEQSLTIVGRQLSILFRVHRVDQNPPGDDKTFVTYEAKLGYALQDEQRLRRRMDLGMPSTRVIEVDISLNDPICQYEERDLAGGTLRVCTLEDIVAEKLRALLQQPIRNRGRRQDLLDIAFLRRYGRALDLSSVATFLRTKAHARSIHVSREAFRSREVLDRASSDYSALQQVTRGLFIPYEEAVTELLRLVSELPINDQ